LTGKLEGVIVGSSSQDFKSQQALLHTPFNYTLAGDSCDNLITVT
jgi:hypothetical protein